MPTISRFYGIVIAMYFGDHPQPHFHAWYAGRKGRVAIATGEWCELRRDAREENWTRVEAAPPLLPVEPLP